MTHSIPQCHHASCSSVCVASDKPSPSHDSQTKTTRSQRGQRGDEGACYWSLREFPAMYLPGISSTQPIWSILNICERPTQSFPAEKPKKVLKNSNRKLSLNHVHCRPLCELFALWLHLPSSVSHGDMRCLWKCVSSHTFGQLGNAPSLFHPESFSRCLQAWYVAMLYSIIN